MLLQLSHFFSPLFPSTLNLPFPPAFPTLVHIYGCTCKFFGFPISHTVLNLPLSILYLPFMLLISCTFSPILPIPLPADNPPCDLYFWESVPVLVICLVCFCFCFFLGSVVDSFQFVVILLFAFLIFFFLEKTL